MLILPLARKPDWRRPPIISLLLVAASVAAFFGLQRDDDRLYQEAEAYYLESPLPDLEFPAYIAHLEERGRAARARALRRALAQESDKAAARVLASMRGNGRFMERLRAGGVITPGHPAFAEWRQARASFQRRMNRVTSQRLGFIPARPQALDVLAHMFLHGSAGHLVGNMVFLVLVGYVVEAVIGRLFYLGVYLLGGLMAASTFAAVYSHSSAPLVGASGAIAALMGTYVLLFELRRIPFFYTLGFYSGFVRAPAAVMLPVWLGLEAYHLLSGGVSDVAYVAHMGGLAGGALLGLGLRLAAQVDMAFLDRDQREEQDRADMEQGLAHLANLDLDAARERFRALLKRNPDHREALAKLYTVASYRPDSDEYHRLAHRIFALSDNEAATLRFKRDTFRDYTANARPQMRFDPDRFLELAGRLAIGGFPEDAAPMVSSFLEKGKEHPRLPQTLVLLARGFARQDEPERGQRYLAALRERFPDSEEAGEARKMLEEKGTQPGRGTSTRLVAGLRGEEMRYSSGRPHVPFLLADAESLGQGKARG
ncbi:rhomboid family intramembrane serine protease [Thiohalorhabdus sp.]|uniref:rhomboid family intramembrane serine protease n=1 Tax=Thiohalorhabdus sp. TaxID=3094134 RepID=UPI002FC3CF3A